MANCGENPGNQHDWLSGSVKSIVSNKREEGLCECLTMSGSEKVEIMETVGPEEETIM